MTNYGINLDVKVKAQQLQKFNKEISATKLKVIAANRQIDNFAKTFSGIAVPSIQNFEKALARANEAFREVAVGTPQAKRAAEDFAKATKLVNEALKEQNILLQDAEAKINKRPVLQNKFTTTSSPFAPSRDPLGRTDAEINRMLDQRAEDVMRVQNALKPTLQGTKLQQRENAEINRQLDKSAELYMIQNKEIKDIANTIRTKKIKQLEAEAKIENEILNAKAKQVQAEMDAIKKAKVQSSISSKRLQVENRMANPFTRMQRNITSRSKGARQAREMAVSNALIGGAFPLLFGQGLGASVGGATGGGAGGLMGGQFGFALSLVGTSVGAQFDKLAQSARQLGEALRNPIKNMDMLVTKMGQANTPFGDTVETLKSLGLEAVAAEAVLNKFNKTFGTNKKSLAELGEESIRFTNELAKLGTSITLFIAGPLSKFLETINDTLGNTTIKGIRRDSKIEARNLAMQKFGINNFEAKKNVDIFSFALSKIRGEKKIDGQTFEEFAKSIEPEIFNRRMNEQGLGGQAGSRDFGNENLQKLIKERRDFELSNMKSQLMIEKQSMTIRSEDLDVLKKRMDLLKIEEKLKVKGLVDTKIMTAEQLKAHEFAIDKLEIEKQISDELLKQSIIMADPMQAALVDLNKEMAKFNDLRFQAVEFAKAFGGAFEESFKGIVSGSMTAQEALRNLFQRTADHFLDMAAQMIAKQIQMKILGIGFNMFASPATKAIRDDFGMSISDASTIARGGFVETVIDGTKATGGPVKKGGRFLVGERGPELFTPGVSGMITPNHALGGSTNVVVNVDASGSSVEGDEQQGRELGRLISVAVQSEILQQKRPGGLLA